MRARRQLGGDTGGQTTGREGGNNFEKNAGERQLRYLEYDQRRRAYEEGTKEGCGDSEANDVGRDASAEGFRIAVATCLSNNREEQHGKGGDLDRKSVV